MCDERAWAEASARPARRPRDDPPTDATMPASQDPGVPSARSSARRSAWTGVDQSSVMGVELLAATLTWAGIGWLADRWLGTGPWLLAIGAIVGNAAGLYLVWLRSGRMDERDRQQRDRPVHG